MNSSISQNIISNETVFEVKGNVDVIGTWQCHHGRNLEVASTKVTTFESIGNYQFIELSPFQIYK